MGRKGIDFERGKFLKNAPAPSRPDSQQYPSFSLRHLIAEPDFSLEHRNSEEKVSLVETLRKLSTLTWAEIRSSPRHGLGCEKIPQNQLRFALPKHVTEEVTILAFRFHGKAPMLGYRDEATFHIICLDPKFTAYKH